MWWVGSNKAHHQVWVYEYEYKCVVMWGGVHVSLCAPLNMPSCEDGPDAGLRSKLGPNCHLQKAGALI